MLISGGQQGLDVADMRAHTQYSGGYHEEHPVIQVRHFDCIHALLISAWVGGYCRWCHAGARGALHVAGATARRPRPARATPCPPGLLLLPLASLRPSGRRSLRWPWRTRPTFFGS